MRRIFSIGLPALTFGLLLAMFSGLLSRAGEAQESPAFFDWSEDSRATFGWAAPDSYNSSVQIPSSIRRDKAGIARAFEYRTGSQHGLVDEDALASARLVSAPDQLLARHQEGKVQVRVWGEGQPAPRDEDFARRIARAIHLATTRIWPREPVPVRVDFHVMPEGAFSLARKVRWKKGQSLELALFLSGPAERAYERHRTVAQHELYHLLSAIHGLGRWTPEGAKTPNASAGFEEVAATSFASCGILLADGYLSRPRSGNTLVLNGVPMKAPLSLDELKRILGVLRHSDERSLSDYGTKVGGVIDTAPVFHLLDREQERIDLQSPEGAKLLGLCREFAPDPLKVEQWLEDLAADPLPDRQGPA